MKQKLMLHIDLIDVPSVVSFKDVTITIEAECAPDALKSYIETVGSVMTAFAGKECN